MFFVGTNDLQNGNSAMATYMIMNQITRLPSIKNKKLIFCQIPPFRDNLNMDTEAIIFNRLQEEIAKESPNITTIKYRHQIEDISEAETYEDNIHLNPTAPAAQIIAKTIDDHMATIDMTHLPTEQDQNPSTRPKLTYQQTEQPQQRKTTPYNQPRQPTTFNQARPFSKSLSVPMNRAGLVIGARQSGITKLETTHKVDIHYISVRNLDPVFKITGPMENVLKAEKEIITRSSDNNPLNTQQRQPPRSYTQAPPANATVKNVNHKEHHATPQPVH